MKAEGVLRIGKIVGVHGIRGELRVYSYAESIDFFRPGNQILISNREDQYLPQTVEKVQTHKNILRLAIAGIDDRNAAEELIGAGVFVQRSMLPETDEDTWYWCDLIGLDVFGVDEDYVGRITSIIETGSNDVLVATRGEKEVLIPAIASVVIHIDIESKTMQVDLPEGL